MRKQRIQAQTQAQVEIINMRQLKGGKCEIKKKNKWEK